MAKGGNKLMRLKSVLKKLNSFKTKQEQPSPSHGRSEAAGTNLHPVYVGKSRRRYLVTSQVISHPLFQQLADGNGNGNGDDTEISVSCEVVLFEHMLWMLENAEDPRTESLHELVEYYAC